ncbi:MAG: hypothetical protein RLZZ241_1407 [Bacteroidota bacterium]|jgi:hypothetical protein
MKIKHFLLTCILIALGSCKKEQPESLHLAVPENPVYGTPLPKPDTIAYYDRVLGALVGSAIGDAMGASTEMWHRKDIRRIYGYLNTLSPAIRPKSPEGTWNNNLPAGSGTDDTRWKAFTAGYLNRHRGNLGPKQFTQSILSYYETVANDLGDEAVKRYPDALDSTLQRVDWIREWARVSRAYQEGPESYEMARDRFYGGEMSCAGMLYTPMFGLVAPDPESAYTMAYQHALFDLGYARDISGLVAALTQMALHTQNSDSLLNTAVFTDPYHYQDSRLVGRIALQQFESARDYVRKARLESIATLGEKVPPEAQKVPKKYPFSELEWLQQEYVYQQLELDKKAIPFHAGEIWEILIAGLEFGQGDFMKSIAFIVNYGRDNDTVAAVAGMILGAQVGFDELPLMERELVLQISRDLMGIDLEAVAQQVVAAGN